jgi:hypothetical protein
MYWDVIEVKPEPDYRLFVRFKDGLTGHIDLPRESLTGTLAPLQDVEFFKQAFIDSGAVAWPGEIDMAPDAMYKQIAGGCRQPVQRTSGAVFRERLPRFFELRELVQDPSHPDAYFQDLEERFGNQACFETYAAWEKELDELDPQAWAFLKTKAENYLLRQDHRGYQQLFDALGEAVAYNYLRKSEGCPDVSFIPESKKPTPDLKGVRDRKPILCEVKTINVSDDELGARLKAFVVRDSGNQLKEGFFRKLDSDISKAKSQLLNYDPAGEARHLIYCNICFDDWSKIYDDERLQQIEQHLIELSPGVDVLVSAGFAREQKRLIAAAE